MLGKSGQPVEIASGVFQLRVPLPNNPLGHVLVYYLPGPYGDTLIDTGWNDEAARAALEEQISLAGGRLRDIRQVLVTHCHPDHAGLAEYVRGRAGATLFVHRREGEWAARRRVAPRAVVEQIRLWLKENGLPPDDHLPAGGEEIREFFPGPADVWLHGGEELPAGQLRLQVVFTPGHSPGHICLYEPRRRLLFAGDHVLPTITPNVGLEPAQRNDNPLADYLVSLRRVAELPADLVLPAHEQAFTSLKDRAEQIAAHHRARTSEIVAHLAREGSTAYQVAQKVSWAVGPFLRLTGWNRYMAVLEVLAHLRMAYLEGLVEAEQRDGVTYFRAR